jgi:hypothetical protein
MTPAGRAAAPPGLRRHESRGYAAGMNGGTA